MTSAATKLAQEHLAFLWPSLQAKEEVQAAKRLTAALDDASLSHLLRKHDSGDEAGIFAWGEILQRRIIDSAVASYSLLTVALIAGYIPAKLDKEQRDDITAFLGRAPLREYYEQRYRVFLPSLLRLHVSGEIRLPQEEGELAWGAYQWFVRFSARFEKDRDLETFLSLLDGFVYGDLDIDSFMTRLADPSQALAGIAKPPDQRSRWDSAVLGLLRFMTFCKELASALLGMSEAPLTQSACWFYYAYWFQEFTDVGGRMETCLGTLDKWVKSSPQLGIASAADAERTVEETRLAMEMLVDGRFAAPLVNRLK